MEWKERISAVERRAVGINLTLAEICRRADVHHSTVYRWLTGDTSPNLRTLDRHIAALEHQIDLEEELLLNRLRKRKRN